MCCDDTVRCAGDVGLARYLPKVNKACARPQSGTETLPDTSEGFIIISRTQKSHFLTFLTF